MYIVIRLLVIFIIAFFLEFYFVRRVRTAIENTIPKISKKTIKRWKIGFLIYFNFYPIFLTCFSIYLRLTTGSGWVHPIDNIYFTYLIVYPFWVLSLLILQTIIYFVLADILRAITFPLRKKRLEKTNQYFHKMIFVLFFCFSIYVPARIFYDLNAVEVTEYIYTKNDLPEQLENFRIVLIADVQADQFTTDSRIEKYIDKINSLEPDLVVIAGDLITSTPNYIKKAAAFVGNIKSKNGVFACVGDHDNWAYRWDYKRSLKEVTDALEEVNIPMIDNDNFTIRVDSAKIGMTFVTDNYVTRIPPGRLDSLTAANHLDFKIFITHQPNQRMVDKAIKYDYNLFFAGHTHGGQLTLLFPFLNPSISHIETEYVKGEYRFENLLMVVNGGLGVSIAPVRYNSTADVSLITLKR